MGGKGLYGPKPETPYNGIYRCVLAPGNSTYMVIDTTDIGVREV